MKSTNATGASVKADADRLADFVLFTQRSCILNLSTELNKGNISFSQFFLLTYLSSEEYLTMSDIAKKMGHSTHGTTLPKRKKKKSKNKATPATSGEASEDGSSGDAESIDPAASEAPVASASDESSSISSAEVDEPPAL